MNAQLNLQECEAIRELSDSAIELIRKYQGQFREVMALIDGMASQSQRQLELACPSGGTVSQFATSPFFPLRWFLASLRRFF